jgi:4-amino-4-deoxy-L-arabinose transferase-like glycosyltransferase
MRKVLFLLLLCVFLQFHNLGKSALFEPDEGRNAEIAREILVTNDWVTPHYNFVTRLDKPIFFYWWVALSYKLFGISEWSARLPSALFGLGCIFLTYYWARTFLGVWEALWGALILATSVEFYVLSRTVILDMALTFFMTLSLCGFYWGTGMKHGGKRRGYYLLMYGASAAATLTKGPVGIILPGMIIFFYLFCTGKWFLLREMNLGLGIALFLTIVMPWYAWAELKNQGYLRYFLLEENLLRFLTPSFNRNHSWYYLLSSLLIGFLPWSLSIAVLVEDIWNGTLDDKTLFLLLWIVLPLFLFSFSSSKLPHYILSVYPPLSILVGKSLAGIIKHRSAERSWTLSLPWIAPAFALLIVAIGLLSHDLLPDHVQGTILRLSPDISYQHVLTLLVLFLILAMAKWSAMWHRLEGLYFSYCSGIVFFFLFVQQILPTVSVSRSSKQLAERAAPWIHSDEQVVIYDAYFPSLPFYLRMDRPMWIVRSRDKRTVMGSTYVAEKHPEAGAEGRVLFTLEEVGDLSERAGRRILIFTRERRLDELQRRIGASPHMLLEFSDVALVALESRPASASIPPEVR